MFQKISKNNIENFADECSRQAECPDATEIIANGIEEEDGIEIPAQAFFQNENLVSVEIGDDVEYIRRAAFRECINLENVNFGSESKLIEIKPDAFRECEKLKSIELPDDVTEIGANAFLNCESLSDLQLNNNLKKIRSNAFRKCSSLNVVLIPDSVQTIASSAFAGCTSLEQIIFPSGVEIHPEAFLNTPLEKDIKKFPTNSNNNFISKEGLIIGTTANDSTTGAPAETTPAQTTTAKPTIPAPTTTSSPDSDGNKTGLIVGIIIVSLLLLISVPILLQMYGKINVKILRKLLGQQN